MTVAKEITGTLANDYLDGYGDFPEHMAPIGKFTYLRTYSRFLEEEARRETWKETLKRATEYNIGLAEQHLTRIGLPIDQEKMDAERRLLFDNQFNLRQALSGRTLWVGGAKNGVAEKFPLANFNCSFTNIGDQFARAKNFDDLSELFYLLLVGTGVGFKVTPQMARNLPPVRQDVHQSFDPYEPLPKWMRAEKTSLITDAVVYDEELRRYEYVLDEEGRTVPSSIAVLAVGDSKEGWVEAVRQYFTVLRSDLYSHIQEIRLNFNSVRPRGEKLKTFGGTASGHEPLLEMFQLFDAVIHDRLDTSLPPLERVETDSPGVFVRLRPIHIADMANGIGHNVVVGGVRRTSEIFHFSGDLGDIDWESLFMKFGINGVWGAEGFHHIERVRKAALDNHFPLPPFFKDLMVRYYDVPDGDTMRTFTDAAEAERFAEAQGLRDFELFPYNKTRMHLGHRHMSNNSMVFHTSTPPSKRLIDFVFLMMKGEAEPGIINLFEAARRRLKQAGITSWEAIERHAYEIGLNPCGEILLRSKGVCNLTTVNVMAFVRDGVLDLAGLFEAQKLSARCGLRMTLVRLELANWDKVQQLDRLLGTSLTGWKDAMDALGFNPRQEKRLLRLLGKTARREANRYAAEMRVNIPLLVTTVKPEGTLSILFGPVSSGLHVAHAPYYMRRIRISATDPLAKAVQQMPGWVVRAEVKTAGYSAEDDLAKPEVVAQARTLVIDFPVKSAAKKTKAETGVDEQFDTYFAFQKEYTEHNTSNTIHLRPEEWNRAADRVYAGWNDFVGVSFLALDGGTYTLMPYMEITQQEYEASNAKMGQFDYDLLREYEQPETEAEASLDEDCATGACPIR